MTEHRGLSTRDLLAWFSEDERKQCPHCNERAAVPRETGPSVCLHCGAAWTADEPGDS